MFPTGAKKRGSGFENPEPSSPKVTCIGQVRVKTKKQTRKMRNMSARRSNGGDVSFRKAEQTQNGRWVHLPVTICEALRAFGSEFNCFLPCRSPCLSTEQKIKEEKKSSCGAVFARWLVALHEGEGKGREIELVVGEEEEEEVFERRRREKIELADVVERAEAEKEGGRVSICIPPKNALLLMRCRSDPLRASSLANRFWDSPGTKEEEEEEDEYEVYEDENEQEKVREFDLKGESYKENTVNGENVALESAVIAVITEEQSITEDEGEKEEEKDDIEPEYEVEDKKETNTVEQEADQSGNVEATMLICSRPDNETTLLQQEKDWEDKAGESAQDERAEEEALAKEEEKRLSDCSSVENGHLSSTTAEGESVKEETSSGKPTEEKELDNNILEAEGQEEEDEEEGGEVEVTYEEGTDPLSEERESEKVERESSPLPDCLLLMMCEPKLSMEVSKETWVCSTDFIRRMPNKQKAVNPTDGIDEVEKKRKSTGSRPTRRQQQPPRSSCSYPDPPPAAAAAASMAMMIEQKLVNAMAYEPFVLTRCKSEPMRSAAKMAVPESCFWKNRKLEPHRRSTVGVGAAGIGV